MDGVLSDSGCTAGAELTTLTGYVDTFGNLCDDEDDVAFFETCKKQ